MPLDRAVARHGAGGSSRCLASHIQSGRGGAKGHWSTAFVRSGLERLIVLGRITQQRAAAIYGAVNNAAHLPAVRMCTRSVERIIARNADLTR